MRGPDRKGSGYAKKGAELGPVRMCVFCRRRYPKGGLVRFVAEGDGVRVDEKMNLPGRGAYCCRNEKCLNMSGLDRKGVLRRALKISVTGDSYTQPLCLKDGSNVIRG